jgi:pilus assembly protein CpaF
MGADTGVRAHEANQMIADAIDLLVQIGIRHEVRRVVEIASISKELKGGDVYFETLYRYNETSLNGAPQWEKLNQLRLRSAEA